MTVVIDASAVVAGLVDGGSRGDWARDLMDGGGLVGPHLLPVEVTQVIRRLVARGEVQLSAAHRALDLLVRLRVALYPFEGHGDRVWALRRSLTAYDAWYVALAEALDAPLATLDHRLTRAPGPRCAFSTPG